MIKKLQLFIEFWKYGFIYELHVSVALNILFSLLSGAEVRGGITKQQLSHKENFGFHGVANAKESRLSDQPIPTNLLILTVFHSCKHVTPEGYCTLVVSTLFSIRNLWNPKHPSYVCIRLFRISWGGQLCSRFYNRIVFFLKPSCH